MFRTNKQHATEFRPEGKGSEFLIGGNGELNAGSKIELMQRQQQLARAVQSREISTAGETAQERHEANIESFKEVAAAYHDNSSQAWQEIGSMVSATLNTSVEREGFMRRILARGELAQGSFPRHRVKRVDTEAYQATGASSIEPMFIRDRYIMPPEWNIHASLMITNKEINQGSADILDEKYYETLKQFMVTEDRVLIAMAKKLADVDNDIVYISGSYTPQSVAQIRGQITHWGQAPSLLLMAANVMEDMIGSPTFANFFDPVSKYDIIMTGMVGTLYGTEVLTDQFRDPKLKVLGSGEIFAFGPPEYVGAYTERGPVETVPVDYRVTTGTPARGWYFNEDLSMTMHSGRSVSYGSKS